MSSTSKRYSPEVRERAVGLVFEHQGEHESQWAAIVSVAAKIGCTSETLRSWVRRVELDGGRRLQCVAVRSTYLLRDQGEAAVCARVAGRRAETGDQQGASRQLRCVRRRPGLGAAQP